MKASLTTLIYGKHSMENFNNTDLSTFSWPGKTYIHKKNTVKCHSDK